MPQGNTGNEPDGGSATSLHDAVKNAFEKDGIAPNDGLQVDNATGQTKIVKAGQPAPAKVEPQQDAAATDDETFEIDASAEEIGHALALHRSLSDPKQRNNTLQQLIERSGYKVETKQQQQQFVDDLEAIFKEELGDSYELLSGSKLQKAVERAVTSRVEKTLKPVLERITAAEEHTQRQLADAEMSALWDRHKVAEKDRPKVADAMMKKMARIAPGEGATASEYMDDIYSLVNRDIEKARAVTTTVKRIKQNAQDANTASVGSEGDDKRIKTGSKLPSAHEAVAAAFRGETLEE